MAPSSLRRFAARMVDWTVTQVVWVPAWIQLAMAYFRGEELIASWWAVAGGLSLSFLYYFLFYGTLGATIGKLIFGLRVVNAHDSRQKINWSQALIRTLADYLSFFFSLAPYSLALLRKDRTHLVDWIAETRVVQNNQTDKTVKQRWVVGSVLTLYFLFSGVAGAFRFFHYVKLTEVGVVVHKSAFDPSAEE